MTDLAANRTEKRKQRRERLGLEPIAPVAAAAPAGSIGDDELPDVSDELPAPPPPGGDPPAHATGKRDRPPAEPTVLKEVREAEAQSIRELIDALGTTDGSYKISVTRKSPQMWKGRSCGGMLASYEELIDEDFVKEHHGGGKYLLKVYRKSAKGSWQYFAARTFEIAGDPRVDNLSVEPDEPAVRVVADPEAAKVKAQLPFLERSMDLMEREMVRARSGDGGAAIAAQLAPLNAFIEQQGRQILLLQQQLGDAQRTPPPKEDGFKDKFLEKLIDGDSARIEALRTRHESEIRQLKQSFQDDEKRWQDRRDRDIADIRTQHEREISALRQSYDMQTIAMKSASDLQLEVLRGDVRRLERDNSELRVEVKGLREKKEQSTGDKIKEIKALKDLVSDGDDKGGGSTAEGIIEKVLESKAAGVVVEKLASLAGGGGAPAPQQPQLPPVGIPFRGPDGRAYMRMADNTVRQLPPPQPRPTRQRRRPAAAPAGAPAPATGGSPPTDAAPAAAAPTELTAESLGLAPTDVKLAVTYLENAFRSGQDPAMVARSVRTVVPEPILKVIRQRGVDAFLDQVAELDSASPLAQQGGRNFTRKVARVLLDGDTGEPPAE
jgi:hypothetical protein